MYWVRTISFSTSWNEDCLFLHMSCRRLSWRGFILLFLMRVWHIHVRHPYNENETRWMHLLKSHQNIRLDEDVLKTFWRRLDQDEYIRLTHASSEDVFKMSPRRLDQDQYICLGHRSSRRLAKTSSRHLKGVFKTF